MRLLLFHYYSKKPNPVYQEMTAAFRRKGHQVWLAEPSKSGDLLIKGSEGIEQMVKRPFPTPRWAKKLPIVPKLLWRLAMGLFLLRVRRAIRQLMPDVVQVNPPTMAWVLPIGMPKSIHFILDIRQINEAVSQTRQAKRRERAALRGMRFNGRFAYEKICFCHEQAAIRVLGDAWQQKGVVVPVGVDDQFNEFQYPDDSPPLQTKRTFVYIGTLSRLRSLERLLQAAKILCQKTDQFQLDLIGPDSSEGYYQHVIDELGIGSVAAVKTAVSYDQVPPLLASYDVGMAYVPDRPTWHYQPTIKVLEYRALGLPIISTDVASHREVIQQDVNGILCADDPQAIANAMYKLTCHPEIFESMRQNARQMRRGNSWSAIAEMYIEQAYALLLTEVSHR